MGWNLSPRRHRKRTRRPYRRAARPAVEHLEPRLAPSIDVLTWRGNVPGNSPGAALPARAGDPHPPSGPGSPAPV
jgi:hypothetical protein